MATHSFLFEGSDGAPEVSGLGLLGGTCFRLSGPVKVPHVGWNGLEPSREAATLAGVSAVQVYFTHSFAAPITKLETQADAEQRALPLDVAQNHGRHGASAVVAA
jgi:imidazoleglycerol phosphate synthase glutamine amidotransferase subunit HisH